MIKALLIAGLLLAPSAAFADTLAITHADAWPMDGRGKIVDATVVVTDGKVVSVTAGGAAPQGARVIDAGGRMVTPGLMNSATQLGLVETGQATETDDMSSSNAALGASFDIQYAVNGNSVLLPVERADGVTRAVTYPGASGTAPFMGQGAVVRLIDAPDILDKARSALYVQISGSTLLTSGGSRSGQWQLLRNALEDARDNAALLDREGVMLGLYSSGNTIYLSYNAGEAMREAAGLAVANGLPYDKALMAMTAWPAKIFGVADHYGTLAAGMDADLVIWDGDPLEPGNYPYKVFVRGVEASLTTRQTLLRDRYAHPDALPPVYHK